MTSKAKPGTIETTRLAHLDFIKAAIQARPNPEKGKGIHTVFSGFNDAFKAYYGLEAGDTAAVIAIVDELVNKGKIAKRFARGGVILYLPVDAPQERPSRDQKAKDLLARMAKA